VGRRGGEAELLANDITSLSINQGKLHRLRCKVGPRGFRGKQGDFWVMHHTKSAAALGFQVKNPEPQSKHKEGWMQSLQW